jgi:RNA polymerase sigma factor (sigma-70 family)
MTTNGATTRASSSASTKAVGRRPVFVTTHWSVVLSAGGNDTACARDALARLCQTYWFPLYAHARRRGNSPHDAQDLTQEFFARLLDRQSLAAADPSRGRFRSFLLAAMNHFLADEWHKARAQKRGGSGEVLSLDFAAAEERFDLEPADAATPDKAFDRQWALTLLNTVLDRLEAEYQREGKHELFAALKQTLAGSRETQPYAELAETLGMNEGAIKTAVHRLRRRYRELLQAEINHTVESPAEAREEMDYLFKTLSGV